MRPGGALRDNREVADVFFEMGDLLQIAGGDPYRVRAFRRTARILENLGEPLQSLIDRNALAGMPGIGEGSVHRIKQILRTGTCDDLVRLKQDLPSGLREILDIKGIGPRTVRIIWSHLRIGTVDELENAARAGRLSKLPRIGERTEEKLLDAIDTWRKSVGRQPLYKALRLGLPIVERMRATQDVVRAELGGSARRRKATIGDLDVLVAAWDGRAATQAFVKMPGVAEVLWGGDGRTSVRLETGQQVDLRIVQPENFGAGMHYFTGSQLHNIAIRARGNRRQLKISEHGVFTRHDEQLIVPGEREEDIFTAVGLPWIAPELRENTGEIEAAEQGRLPELVTAEDLQGDLHMHTVASDGKGTAREMADAALKIGHKYIAITEHTKSLTIANGLDERRLTEHARMLRDLEQHVGRLHVLAGIEVDILEDGDLDLDASVLKDLDWVVGSVHSRFEMSYDDMTERIVRAMESGLVDCVGHPFGRYLGERKGYAFDLERVLKVALRTGVALEVNGSPKRMDLDDVHARQCREAGVPIAINTDAHAPDHLAHREYGLAMARRGWCERKDVLNAWPVDVLRDRRRDRLRKGTSIGVAWTPAPVDVAPPPADVPKDAASTEALARLLVAPVAPEIAERLQRYLVEGDDELDAALRTLSDNPLGKAFELVLASATES